MLLIAFLVSVLFSQDEHVPLMKASVPFIVKTNLLREHKMVANIVYELHPFFPEETLIRSTELIKELELSGSQTTDIKRLLNEADKTRRDFAERHPREGIKYSPRAREEYWSLGLEMQQKLYKVLDVDQRKRSSQLLARAQLKSHGFLEFLKQREDVGLSSADRSNLISNSKQLAESLDEDMRRVSKEFFDHVSKPLTNNQRVKFKELIGREYLVNDFLLIELEDFEKKSSLSIDDDFFDSCRLEIELRWDEKELAWKKIERVTSLTSAFGQIISFVRDNKAKIELSNSQIKRLDSLHAETRKLLMQNPYDYEGLSRREQLERRKQIIKENEEKLRAELEEVFLPHQKEVLTSYAKQKLNFIRGPLVMLARGEYDAELRLERSQRNEMKKRLLSAKQDLKKNLSDLEERYLKKYIEPLGTEKKKRIMEIIGERPDAEHPNILLLRRNLLGEMKGVSRVR